MLDEETARILVYIVVALGGGTLIPSLINTLYKIITGRAETRRTSNLTAAARVEVANKDRLNALEYASMLRSQLLEHNIKP